ncbi:reverse transcriptase domain-containing protein [Tanacetum coccineum]
MLFPLRILLTIPRLQRTFSPASREGNTSSDSSEDLSKDLLASLAILPFHDDPYMKVMQAYNATDDESPIPPPLAPIAPPTVLPPSPKRARSRSSSSTSALPQVFEIGESSHKTSLERHEEQIETILNHLDELPLERIEHMEDKIEGLGNGRVIIQRDFDQLETELQEAQMAPPMKEGHSTSAALAMTQATIKKLVADTYYKRVYELANLYNLSTEGAVGLIRWFERTESPIGIEEAYKIHWSELKKLLIKKYCPRTEVKKMEDGFYNLTVKGNDPQELRLEDSRNCIEGNVTASKPQTLEEAITITQKLMDQCPKANNNAHGRAYLLRDKNAHQDPNVVTGMLLLNQHLARVLFDSGVDKSFVSISLASMLNIPPITLDTTYDIEMADGNLVGTNTVIQGCTLILLNQPFKIDLMLIKLGSFDVVIGMDWLSKYHARIICDEKVVHIPINGETLII